MIDHRYTKDPVCPWCGHIDRDPWEWVEYGGDTEHECGSCGKQFSCSDVSSPNFITNKIDDDGEEID